MKSTAKLPYYKLNLWKRGKFKPWWSYMMKRRWQFKFMDVQKWEVSQENQEKIIVINTFDKNKHLRISILIWVSQSPAMGVSNYTVSGLGMANGWLSLNTDHDRHISCSTNKFKIKLSLLNTRMHYVFLFFCFPIIVAVVSKYVFFTLNDISRFSRYCAKELFFMRALLLLSFRCIQKYFK